MTKKPNDAAMIEEVIDKHKQRQNKVFERQWMINLAMYCGNQYIMWNRMTNRIMPLPMLRPHQVRLVSNKILPAVQMAVGKMMKTMPRAEVIPPDGDEKKVNIAKVATKVLEYRDRVTDHEAKLQKMILWAALTGTSFMKHTWNPALGSEMEIDGEIMREGDEESTACSPFEICQDPLGQDVESCHWMMHYRLQDPKFVKEMWGVDVEPTESTAQDMFGLMDMRLAGDAVLGGVYMPPKGVLVKEYWERPCDDYPDGRLIIVAGDQLAYYGKNYMGELPFVKFGWFDIPNSFWEKGIVDDMIPLQKNYNRRRSQIAENANLMANPIWKAPLGAFTQGKEPTNAPAQIVEFNPVNGMEPKMEQAPSLPQHVFEDMSKSEQEMSDVSGMRQIGPGMLPPGVRAAAALALVNEMDQTLITPIVRNLESAIRQSARMRLKLIKMFYSTPRDIHVAGNNRSFAVEQFKGADLDGEFDISIQSVSGLPQDKTARFQMLQELAKMGIIDQMKFLELMELSDVDEVFEDIQEDMNAAQWENDQMKKGKPQPVKDFENHQIHIYEHNKFRKTLLFKKLPQHVQDEFEQHVHQHQMFQSQSQGGDQSQQPPTQGPPGQPPMPGQPMGPPGMQPMQGPMLQPPIGGPPGYNPASALQGGMTNVADQLKTMMR